MSYSVANDLAKAMKALDGKKKHGTWHSELVPLGLLSALCGTPPSTPCCVCCFGAPPSCTEVFTIGVIQIPPRTPLELHAPLSLARAASSLLSLLPSRAPSLLLLLVSSPLSFFRSWLPLPVSLPLCVVACLLPLCFGLLLCLLVLFLSGVLGLVFPVFCLSVLLVWWAVLAARLLR